MNKAKLNADRQVLLLFPPFGHYAFGDKWEETESILPPLGLLYLATPLLKENYDVELMDLNVDKLEKRQFIKIIKDKDFILISCFTDSFENVQKIIRDIRKVNKKVFIICGGPHCTISKKNINGSDLTVIGEAEGYITKILNLLWLSEPLKDIPGLIYEKEGKVIRNPGIMKVDNLNLSRPPALDLAKNKKYGHLFGSRVKIAPVMSSRGCPFKCSYCTFKFNKYRERTIKNVIEEIKNLVKKGFKYIIFCDDNFLLNKRRVHRIMDAIIEEKIRVKIIVQGRVDSVDYKLYKKLRRAGVIMIMFGIESANQDVLDFYNKQVSVDKIKEAVKTANKVGLLTFGYFIIGAPMETYKHFGNNKKLVNSIPLDFTLVSILTYLIGTKLWDDAYEKGLIEENEVSVAANKKLSNFSYKELVDIRDRFVEDFYKNPRRILRIVYKVWRMGLLPLFIRGLLNRKLYQYASNPYVPENNNKAK